MQQTYETAASHHTQDSLLLSVVERLSGKDLRGDLTHFLLLLNALSLFSELLLFVIVIEYS